ncbi:BglG family transcription antiterminator [Traorella massiliensis]|uniref:BglG family transcription antiterminator n=1 Tax=Traorella massiliensis TaxID=1903263 RepID=UPI002357E233|nr:PTS sugar transporter subunit IIA [Traorella massiliensis]
MNNKQIEILQYLIKKNDCVTSSELQSLLNVSRRTVINYINDIKYECKGLIVSSKNGYQITNIPLAKSFINQNDNSFIENYSERRIDLLHRMILGNEIIDIDEAADYLCISIATLHNDILKLNSELKKANLSIKTKKNKLYLIGSFKDKRKYITSLLNSEIEQRHFDLNSFQSIFNSVDVNQIQSLVLDILKEKDYFIDDYSLLNYVLHLSVVVETLIQSPDTEFEENTLNFDYASWLMPIVEKIYEQLKQLYNINFSIKLILDASLLMSTRIISKNYGKLPYDEVSNLLDIETISIVNTIIEQVNRAYGLDLKIDNFMVRFAFHIQNLLIRSKNNYFLPTNHFISIKNDYPFLYLIAEYIGSIIHQITNITLNEVEISYIALHLGVLMEEKQTYAKNINCAIVTYDYYNSGKLLFQKLSSEISGLYLSSVVSSYSFLEKQDNIDLIITTLPIDPTIDIPSVQVNMIPTREDYQSLIKKIEQLRSRLSTKEIEKNIRKFIKRELFFISNQFDSRNEVITYLCKKMEQNNYVNHEYMDAVLAREKIASSAYKNLALPHPVDNQFSSIKESAISVLISSNPIKWEDDYVNYVFMLAFKSEDRNLTRDVFDFIISSLNNKQVNQKIIDCKDYDEFINTIISII